MKKVFDEHWTHKGLEVFGGLDHPSLYGRYEIYKGEEFLARASSLKEAKDFIDGYTHRTWRKNNSKK